MVQKSYGSVMWMQEEWGALHDPETHPQWQYAEVVIFILIVFWGLFGWLAVCEEYVSVALSLSSLAEKFI